MKTIWKGVKLAIGMFVIFPIIAFIALVFASAWINSRDEAKERAQIMRNWAEQEARCGPGTGASWPEPCPKPTKVGGEGQ